MRDARVRPGPPEGRQSLRRRILAGEPTVGTFLNLGSPITAEICAMAGCDWLLIDLEHGSGSHADLVGQLQAISGTGATPLVRVELPARTPSSRALDPGAGGIMFPRIESAAEARQAISFMRYPPDGIRGVAGQNRSGRFGRVPIAEIGTLDDDLVGIIQIETLGALAEIEDIAAVARVELLFVGAADLYFALGLPWGLAEPRKQ
jgi:4-hydroxy-2-oxoheptanedioate aldolase